MNPTYNAALSFLAGSYDKPEPPPAPINVAPPVEAGSSAPKSKDEAPITKKSPIVLPPDMPSKGTYDAPTFLALIRDIPTSPTGLGALSTRRHRERLDSDGKTVLLDSAPYVTFAEHRANAIRAIAGYVGFDPSRDFGEQDAAARRRAALAINPIKAAPFKRCLVNVSIGGFVAGMPHELGKRIQDLLARERNAVAAMLAWRKVSDQLTFAKTAREWLDVEEDKLVALCASVKGDPSTLVPTCASFAAIEEERITQIRADLASLAGKL